MNEIDRQFAALVAEIQGLSEKELYHRIRANFDQVPYAIQKSCMDFFSRLGVTIYICLIFRYMKNHFNGNKLFGYDLLCFFEIRILCHNFGRRQMYSLSCFLLFPSMMGVPWLRSGFSSSAFTIVGYFSTVS